MAKPGVYPSTSENAAADAVVFAIAAFLMLTGIIISGIWLFTGKLEDHGKLICAIALVAFVIFGTASTCLSMRGLCNLIRLQKK